MDEQAIIARMKHLADQLGALRRSALAVVLIETADEAYDQLAP